MNITFDNNTIQQPTKAILLIDGVTNIYKGLTFGENLVINFFLLIAIALTIPILFLSAMILSFFAIRDAKKTLNKIKSFQIETEEDFDNLKAAYKKYKEIEKKMVNPAENLPRPLSFLLTKNKELIQIIKESRIAAGQKLYPPPPHLTEEQLNESREKLKASGYYESFPDDDDDDDYYQKMYLLGKIKFQDK